MSDGTGIALIAAGAVVAVATAFLLRTRAPAPLVAAILALCGLALGAGALILEHHPSTADRVLTLVLLTVVIPAHVRVVLGPFGPRTAST